MIRTSGMSDTKVAIFSDLHLGVHQNSSFWHDTSLKWCGWFINELERKDIKTILFLGDFFHYRDEVAVNTLDVGYQILSRLSRYNIIMIPGNHDSFYKEHSAVNSLNIFSGWENLQVIVEPTVIQFGNKSAAFIPWGGAVDSKTDYLFGHFEINSFRMNGVKVCEKGRDAFSLLDKSKKIFSGHFHLRDRRQYENGTITYVGNPFEMDFGDSGDTKGVYFLDFSTDELSFIENTQSPKHIRLLTSKITSEEYLNNVKVVGNIVKLVVDKKINVDNVESLLAQIATLIPASASVDYLIDSNHIDIIENAPCTITGVNMESVIAEFINLIEIDDKQDLYTKCIDIYNQCK